MKKVLFIGIGGAAGAVTRFLILQIPCLLGYSDSRIFTMLVNITGSYLLGFMLNLFLRKIPKPEIKLGITTGFLGGYTTFSTFCKDTAGLWLSGNFIFSALYLFLSVAFGLAAVWAGIETEKYMIGRNAE